MSDARRGTFYLAVFLIAGLVMAMQILQSRVFSVTTWYHLSFLVISIAMFGLTLGALSVHRGDEEEQRRRCAALAARAAYRCGLSLLAALAVQMLVPIAGDFPETLLTLPSVAATTALPYYFAGVAVTLSLTRSPLPAARVYGWDLLGAAAGCLIAIVLMNALDAPSALILLSACGMATSLFYARASGKPCPDSSNARLLAVVLAGLALANAFILPKPAVYPLWTKSKLLPQSAIEHEKWNTISRITVTEGRTDGAPFLWGPSPLMPDALTTSFKWLTIDGDAGTPIPRFSPESLADHAYLPYDVTNIAYALPGLEDAAIIGVGGGRDLLAAKYFGLAKVTAMDINPVQISLLRDDPVFTQYNRLRELPGVTLVPSEARSWFRRNTRPFDLIQMSLIDTWAATGAGAFALSENGLYTVQAWKTFLNDLSDRGVYTVSRWYQKGAPNEVARMASLAVEALFSLKVQTPRDHIFIAASKNIATLVLARHPLTPDQLAALRGRAERMRFDILAAPGQAGASDILAHILGAKDSAALAAYTATLPDYDFSPATDMRPFFFNQVRMNDPVNVLHLLRHGGAGAFMGHAKATLNLFLIILFSAVMVAAVILAPLRGALRGSPPLFIGAGTFYFLMIGTGFMLVEIAMLQAFGVFLGHPVYGLGVVLFSLILAAGLGSLLCDRLPLKTQLSQILWCLSVCAAVFAIALTMGKVFERFGEYPLSVRAMLTVALIFPAGVLMGFGFPAGLALVQRFNARATAWFWGINGAAGVLAGAVAVALNIGLGLDRTLMIGGLCYFALALPLAILGHSARFPFSARPAMNGACFDDQDKIIR